jgi:hypothetical protein
MVTGLSTDDCSHNTEYHEGALEPQVGALPSLARKYSLTQPHFQSFVAKETMPSASTLKTIAEVAHTRTLSL